MLFKLPATAGDSHGLSAMALLRQGQKFRIVIHLPNHGPIFRSDMAETVYQFEAKDSQGRSVGLDTLRGKVILVVNVASK